ncbi:MAG: phage portal protein [Gemmatimonadota bacterium]|nr:phage portal protein [Gemmatimonadota bacterium]
MGLLGRLRRLLGPEKREGAPFTDAIVDAFEEGAARRTGANAAATAAVEAAASAYGRAFAASRVSPAGPRTDWITPGLMNLVAREMIRRGEMIARLYVSGGRVQAAVAGSWYIRGPGAESRRWTYQLTEYGPSDSRTRWVPSASVLHFTYAVAPERPWAGLSPVQVASAEGRLHGAVVEALADEARGPRGSLLPIPQDGEEDNLDGLKRTIGALRGKLAVVETVMAGWGEGRPAAPREDWRPQRIGFNAPDVLRNLRSDTGKAVLSACGVPVELVTAADGTGQREAYRRFLFGSILPLARMVERELGAKLEADVRLDFSELMASDLAGRARAFQSMVGAGMQLERAAALAGLMTPEP